MPLKVLRPRDTEPNVETSDLALHLNTGYKVSFGNKGSVQIRKDEPESSSEEDEVEKYGYDNPWEPKKVEEELPWY